MLAGISSSSAATRVSRLVLAEVQALSDSATAKSFGTINHCGAPAYDEVNDCVALPWQDAGAVDETCVSFHDPVTLAALEVIDVRGRLSAAGVSASLTDAIDGINGIEWDEVRGVWWLCCIGHVYGVSLAWDEVVYRIATASTFGYVQGVSLRGPNHRNNLLLASGDGVAMWEGANQFVEWDPDTSSPTLDRNVIDRVPYTGAGHTEGMALYSGGIIAPIGQGVQAYPCNITL